MTLLTNKVPSLRKRLHHVKHGYLRCILLFSTQSVLLGTREWKNKKNHLFFTSPPQLVFRRTTNTQQYTYIFALIRHTLLDQHSLPFYIFYCQFVSLGVVKPFTIPSSFLSSLFRFMLEFCWSWSFVMVIHSFVGSFYISQSANLVAFMLPGFVVETLWE